MPLINKIIVLVARGASYIGSHMITSLNQHGCRISVAASGSLG